MTIIALLIVAAFAASLLALATLGALTLTSVEHSHDLPAELRS